MTPPRVKLYGLIPITRRRYIIQLVVALVLAAGLLLGWLLYWPKVRATLEASRSPAFDGVIRFWNVAPFLVLGIVALQLIEAWIVLRMFRRMEAEQVKPSARVGCAGDPVGPVDQPLPPPDQL